MLILELFGVGGTEPLNNNLLFLQRGDIQEKVWGSHMGSPCSAIIANIFMEWLELNAFQSFGKRYVDDILEIMPRGSTQKLTDHFNKAGPTNSSKFTHEEEAEGQIPFERGRISETTSLS